MKIEFLVDNFCFIQIHNIVLWVCELFPHKRGFQQFLAFFTYWLPNTSLKARGPGFQPLYPKIFDPSPSTKLAWVLILAKFLKNFGFFRNLCFCFLQIISITMYCGSTKHFLTFSLNVGNVLQKIVSPAKPCYEYG